MSPRLIPAPYHAMLGQETTEVPDIDSISLDELIISDTTDESAVKCRNIPVPSNSPDLIEQVS